MTREQMLAAIRADYDAQYFVRGVGDMAAYAPDCTFAGTCGTGGAHIRRYAWHVRGLHSRVCMTRVGPTFAGGASGRNALGTGTRALPRAGLRLRGWGG